MGVNFGTAISNGFKFATVPKRSLLMAISIVVAWMVIGDRLLGLIGAVGTANIGVLLSSGLSFFLLIIVASLYFLFLNGLFIHNYSDMRSLGKSAGFVKSRFFTLLLAMILVTAISMIFSLVPYIAFLVSIIIALIFYFVQQEILIGNKGVVNSLEGSFEIFKNNILQVIIAIVLVFVLTILITAISAIPLLIGGIGVIGTIMTGNIASILQSGNIFVLAIGGIILLIGSSISSIFALGFNTDVYLQLTKKPRLAKQPQPVKKKR